MNHDDVTIKSCRVRKNRLIFIIIFCLIHLTMDFRPLIKVNVRWLKSINCISRNRAQHLSPKTDLHFGFQVSRSYCSVNIVLTRNLLTYEQTYRWTDKRISTKSFVHQICFTFDSSTKFEIFNSWDIEKNCGQTYQCSKHIFSQLCHLTSRRNVRRTIRVVYTNSNTFII